MFERHCSRFFLLCALSAGLLTGCGGGGGSAPVAWPITRTIDANYRNEDPQQTVVIYREPQSQRDVQPLPPQAQRSEELTETWNRELHTIVFRFHAVRNGQIVDTIDAPLTGGTVANIAFSGITVTWAQGKLHVQTK
jgi:hypothetical protein